MNINIAYEVQKMKKRVSVILCLVLAAALLTGCSLKSKNAETVTIPPAENGSPATSAAPAPETAATPETAPTDSPAATPEAAPTPEPTPAPTLEPTLPPTLPPTQAPAASKLPVVTKDPTDETVAVGGKCQFVTRYENAKWAEWHFVSPDGRRDLDYLQAAREFPTLKIVNGEGKDLTLENVPTTLGGWRVYCRFSNDAGSVKTASALITVTANAKLPRITKDPTGETVAVGGKCQFVTRYENAKLAEWHFVSPDGARDLTYAQASHDFYSLKITGGNTKDMTLSNIPAELNGWKVYCRFSNDFGSADSAAALITVKGQPAPSTQRQGLEGRWADEIAGRCQVTFTYRAEGAVNVSVSWSSSAWQRARWTMTAYIYKNDIWTYSDGHYWVETYTDDTHFTTSDDAYNGTGSFSLRDGKVHWVDDRTGEEHVLIPA